MNSNISESKNNDITLPGFRFHPTDEELVGYYLKRKIQRLPLPLQLINQLDIYKFDPWDLPKLAAYGEKEWYFYCLRGRKYRNSTRPNRVTVNGFWKATGIDKPVYSSNGAHCIGLKKSLVFYRGRAASGLKTDWMMHEFRLPSIKSSLKSPPLTDSWAICRIFKKTRPLTQFADFDSQKSFANIAPLEAPLASESTVNTASMMSNQFLIDTTPSEAVDHQNVIDFEWLLPETNGFSGSFLEEKVQEILDVGEDGGGFMKNPEVFLVNNQWEELRSIGFPVSLQANDAWKPSFPFDLTKFC